MLPTTGTISSSTRRATLTCSSSSSESTRARCRHDPLTAHYAMPAYSSLTPCYSRYRAASSSTFCSRGTSATATTGSTCAPSIGSRTAPCGGARATGTATRRASPSTRRRRSRAAGGLRESLLLSIYIGIRVFYHGGPGLYSLNGVHVPRSL